MTDPSVRIEPKAVPDEIDRWNWGAFLLNWIWGIGNRTPIALLTFVPIIGLVMPFVLGAKGSVWAWRNRHWDSVEHFQRVQRSWAVAGAVIWVMALGLVLAGSLIGSFYHLWINSEAYQLGISRINASSEAADVLGTPISAGFPLGSIQINNGSGKAVLTFSATGPKAAGQVSLEASRTAGVWSLKTLTLKVEGSDSVIDLLKQSTAEPRTEACQAVEGGITRLVFTHRLWIAACDFHVGLRGSVDQFIFVKYAGDTDFPLFIGAIHES
jgi:hypothetical protein